MNKHIVLSVLFLFILCLYAYRFTYADAIVECGPIQFKIKDNYEPTLLEAKMCLFLREQQTNTDPQCKLLFQDSLVCADRNLSLIKEIKRLNKRLKERKK